MTKDLTGYQIGSLKVLKKDGTNNDRRQMYSCECECGNICLKSSVYLSGKVKIKSCGCANAKNIKDKKFGMLKAIKKTDKRAYGRVVWLFECACGRKIEFPSGYVISGKVWSCGCAKKENVNLKKSLEETCVFGTNIPAIRSKKISKRNKSGTVGVFYDDRRQKWCAEITFQRYTYRLGRYTEKQDAITARTIAESKRDEFVKWYDNLPDEDKKYYSGEYKNKREEFNIFLHNFLKLTYL